MRSAATYRSAWVDQNRIERIVDCARVAGGELRAEDDFRRALTKGAAGKLFISSGIVVGYVLYRPGVNCYRILDLAVHPDHRHNGLGRKLLEVLTDRKALVGRDRVVITVRERNLALQTFLAHESFIAVKVCRNKFGDQDGFRFEYMLGD